MGKKKINQEERILDKKEKIADYLQLPKDIVLGASIITALGNHELWIENFKGIIDYTEESILLQGKKYRILIKGKGLKITYYTKEEIKIYGLITDVSYQ